MPENRQKEHSMGNFQICLDATAPLLLYLAAGYLARRLKQIDSQDVSRFNSVVFNFFLTVCSR